MHLFFVGQNFKGSKEGNYPTGKPIWNNPEKGLFSKLPCILIISVESGGGMIYNSEAMIRGGHP